MADTFVVKLSYKGKSAYVDDISYETSSTELIASARKDLKIKKQDALVKLIYKNKIIAEEIVDGENIGCYNHPAFDPSMNIGKMGAKVNVQVEKLGKKKAPVDPNRFKDDGVWGQYKGDLDPDGKRSGIGQINWEDGNTYTGEWSNNKPNGKGSAKYANGDSYEGEVRNGKRNGQGKYIHRNGDMYIGEYKDGLRCGHGTYRKNGEVYCGDYKAGERNGKGTFHWRDGCVDIGHYTGGKDKGDGVRFSKDRKEAYLLRDGKETEEIGLAKARALASQMGFSESKINETMTALEALTIG